MSFLRNLFGRKSASPVDGQLQQSSEDSARAAERAFGAKSGTFVDPRDGQTYRTVKIGDHLWMAENLRASVFLDGSPIPKLRRCRGYENQSAASPYADNPENIEAYGLLYSWHAIVDSRGLCPEGWHIPSEQEWKALEYMIGFRWERGGDMWQGTDEGNLLKEAGTIHWLAPNNGSDRVGFSARPGGYFDNLTGKYDGIQDIANFWSTMSHNSDFAYKRRLCGANGKILQVENEKCGGLSVRCIKGPPAAIPKW